MPPKKKHTSSLVPPMPSRDVQRLTEERDAWKARWESASEACDEAREAVRQARIEMEPVVAPPAFHPLAQSMLTKLCDTAHLTEREVIEALLLHQEPISRQGGGIWPIVRQIQTARKGHRIG